MEQIRAFIAIELPDAAKEHLTSLRARLRPAQHPYIKWVAPEGIHLTLKFLGNIPQERVPQITEAMARVAQGVSPFRVQIGGLGAFPNMKRPQVIWVAIEGEVEQLITLHQGIDQALIPLGFAPESRPFTPHLTLGRLKERASPEERKRIGEHMAFTEFESGPTIEVTEINLMRSRLTPQGAIYSRIAAVELRGGLPTSPL